MSTRKRFSLFFTFILISFTLFAAVTRAQISSTSALTTTPVNVYLFHLETCPHCRDQIAWWQENPGLLNQVNLQLFEARNPKNRDLFAAAANTIITDQTAMGAVPFLVIGSQAIIGFDENSTPGEILGAVAKCQEEACPDVVGKLPTLSQAESTSLQSMRATNKPAQAPLPSEPKSLSLPLIGAIDTSTLSLPLLSVVLGLMDGFNPCAMWVLFFLITLLLKVEDPRRRWILGITFIVASGAVYFFLMAAWLISSEPSASASSCLLSSLSLAAMDAPLAECSGLLNRINRSNVRIISANHREEKAYAPISP